MVGKERVELPLRDRAAEPAEAREEDELELRDHRPGEPHEEVVEAAVVEVVLDPAAADPADPAVDDDELAVVEVAELARRAHRVGAHDADVDAAGRAARRTRGPPSGREPCASTTSLTETPSAAFASRAVANRSPIAPAGSRTG